MAETLDRPSPESPSCIHHWILNEPTAGVVSGRCKRCGVDRAFPARPEGLDYLDGFRDEADRARVKVNVSRDRATA